jgi:hypothetical protein
MAIGLGVKVIIAAECTGRRRRRPKPALRILADACSPSTAVRSPDAPDRPRRAMNVQFDWWLILVGLVVGAGLTWLVLAEVRRRDDDVSGTEREVEARWIVSSLAGQGTEADTDAVEEVLRLHRTYLANAPSGVSIWDAGDPSWPTPEDLAAPHSAWPPEPGGEPAPPLTAVAPVAAHVADSGPATSYPDDGPHAGTDEPIEVPTEGATEPQDDPIA